MQSIQLKRELGDIESAFKVCNQVIVKDYRSFHKMWLIKA